MDIGGAGLHRVEEIYTSQNVVLQAAPPNQVRAETWNLDFVKNFRDCAPMGM